MSKNKKQQVLTRKITVWSTLGILLVDPMSALGAPIMPDTQAPAVYQPLVQETANGVPLVNITAPTAGGVSRNQYESFNVPTNGAILNNSYTLSDTKLAGFVQGNQNMVKGPATIIVNEVTSANPTAMNGFIEVAGNRASVVVANPNGITVNGGGFINTNQVMLTTGQPIYDGAGNLTRLDITGGDIRIEGTGLDATTTGKLDILTRAATINAGIWGQDINVITGTNQVAYDTLAITPIGKERREGVALDVSALGGMYAHRIVMIGTEQGMGVNMAGHMESATTLTLDAAGNLYNTGRMQSKETEAITIQDLVNTGTLGTEAKQHIEAQHIANSGLISAKEGQAITGATLRNEGRITSEGTEQLSAQTVTNTGAIHSQGTQTLAVTEAIHNGTTGTITSGGAQQLAASTIDNEGTVQTENRQTVTVATLTNTGLLRADENQQLKSTTLTNAGTLYSGQDQTLHSATITNIGSVYAKGTQETTAERLDTNKTWGSLGAMTLAISKTMTNRGLVASGLTDDGKLTGESALSLSAATLDNANGQVLSSGSLEAKTQQIINTEGYIGSQSDMALTVSDTLNNTKGTVVSDGSLQVTVPHVINENGELGAQGTATIHAETIDNQSGHITGISGTTVIANKSLSNTKGTVTSQGNLTVTTPVMQLDGVLAAGKDAVITTTGDLSNRNTAPGYGVLSAGGNVTLSTTGVIDSDKPIEAGGTLTIQAKGLIQQRTAESNGRLVDLQVDAIDNVGLIQADQNLTITAKTLANHSTGRIYGDGITIKTDTLDNYADTALEAKLAAEMERLQEREAALNAAFAVDVTVFTTGEEEDAYKAKIADETARYEAQLAVVKDVIAQLDALPAGTIAGRTSVAITTDTLRNLDHSLIYSGGNLTLVGKTAIHNAGGTIEAMGDMTLTTPQLRNTNTAFSAERKITKEATLGDTIRIDEIGHFEQGQSFPKEEFSNLSSGYGATHNAAITWREELDEAQYDTVRALTLKEILAGVEPPDPELIGKYMPNYTYDDPIFAQFGITSMSTPRPADGDPNQATWDAHFQAIFDELNPKIRAYNEEVRAYNESLKTPPIHHYTIQRRHTLESELFMTSNRNGLIRSGQSMAIQGDVLNDNSKLVAGGDLTITGALHNPAVKAQTITYTFGTDQQSYTYKRGWPHKSRRRGYKAEVAVTPTVQLGNLTPLGQAGEEGNTNTRPAGKDITSTQRADVAKVLDPLTPTKGAADNITATVLVAPIQPITLPSLYFVHPETTARYVVETDPRFTNKKQFLSSDYMTEQLGWNPDRVQKKLGDGFYEQELIRNQIMALTGKRYRDGYSSDEESFKALMDQGIAFAKEHNLTMGVSLTAEQMAQLTSDIVWLESKDVTVNGQVYTVLYPHVYMQPGQGMTLQTDGSLISGKNLVVKTTKAIENEGTLLGNTIVLNGSAVRNSGLITGGSILANSTGNIESTGQITGTDRVQLVADENLSIHNTINRYANQEAYNQTAGIALTGQEGVLLLGAKKDLTIQGAVLQNLGKEGSTLLQAGENLALTTDTLSATKAAVLDTKNYSHSYDRIDQGTTIQTAGDLQLVAGDSITAKAATLSSESGAVQLAAGKDITLTSGEAMHNQDYGISYKSRGFLSSTKTTIKTEQQHTGVVGTAVTGQTVSLQAGQDVSLTAAQIGSTERTSIAAGGNINSNSAEQYDYAFSDVNIKKSGLMGAGMGLMIGTQKTTDRALGEGITQVGTLIGSLQGNVTMKAGEDIHLTSSNIVGATGIHIEGRQVTLDGKENISREHYVHETSSSGLSVSLGGTVVSVGATAVNYIQQAGDRKDKRLAALELLEAGQSLQGVITDVQNYKQFTEVGLQNAYRGAANQAIQDMTSANVKAITAQASGVDWAANASQNATNQAVKATALSTKAHDTEAIKKEYAEGKAVKRDNLINLRVGIGSSHSKSVTDITEITYAGGRVQSSDGMVQIIARGDQSATNYTDGDITAIGQTIRGEIVKLQAQGNINLLAGTNTTHIIEYNKKSGWSVGANIGTTGFLGADIGINKARSEGVSDEVTHTGTTVNGMGTVTMTSGNNTNITGSVVSGGKVIATVGENLNITSLQERDSYLANSRNSSLSVGFSGAGITSVLPYTGKGKTNSTYESVTKQAGIYAGKEGFDITVKENISLTGALIDSAATSDKNSLATGTLALKDIENKADYDSSYRGIGYTYDRKYKDFEKSISEKGFLTADEMKYLDDMYNKVGLVPDLGMHSADNASSTTISAIAPGNLTVTNQEVNLDSVNRNTKNSLHELDKIFDKKNVEERQELAKLFAKNANEAIHKISESKGWKDGSAEKVALHSFVAGIATRLGGNSFSDGAITGGVNEATISKLIDVMGSNNPDAVQIVSAVLGYATNKLIGKEEEVGAMVAQWGTKWNNMYDNDITEGPFLTFDDALSAMNINLQREMAQSKYNVEYDNQVEFESRYYWAMNKLGAAIASLTEEYELAGKLLEVALQGGGNQRFAIGSLAANKLNSDPNLISLVNS